MNQPKEFHIAVILSIIHDKVLAPGGKLSPIVQLLNFMTDDSAFTHQIGRFMAECKPALLEQFPRLVNVDCEGVGQHNYDAWLKPIAEQFGLSLEVKPLKEGQHEVRDPVEEAELMFDGKVITVLSA